MRLKYITFIMILLYISGVTNCQTAEKNSSSNDSYILTPDPSPEPKINGAKVFGVRPGSPVIFTIPATGTRPMTFSAKNLPDGLALNRLTGRFSGSIEIPGTYNITLYAKNGSVSAEREFRIIVGDKLALTPPMGWNLAFTENTGYGMSGDRKIWEFSRRVLVQKYQLMEWFW